MAYDALQCFANLLEIVPTWIAELQGILDNSKAKRDTEYEKESAAGYGAWRTPPSVSSSLQCRMSPKRAPWDARTPPTPNPQSNATMPPSQPTNTTNMEDSDVLRLAMRKRKPSSHGSAERLNPVKFRSRGTLVVQYDGETQSRFEAMVRAIGISRNSLRKGKMRARVDLISRIPSTESSSGDSTDEAHQGHSRHYAYRKESDTRVSTPSKPNPTEALDQMDSLLEKAQTLCERAAHQILRDGDCAVEIREANQFFAEARTLGEAEMPSLRRRAAQSTAPDRRNLELAKNEARNARAEQSGAASVNAGASANESTPDQTAEKVEDPFASPASLEVDLEADDSDDSGLSPEFTFATLNSKYGFRSTRVGTLRVA